MTSRVARTLSPSAAARSTRMIIDNASYTTTPSHSPSHTPVPEREDGTLSAEELAKRMNGIANNSINGKQEPGTTFYSAAVEAARMAEVVELANLKDEKAKVEKSEEYVCPNRSATCKCSIAEPGKDKQW